MKIDISKILVDILLEDKLVCIPGFGSFILKHIPASYGENRQSLFPPSNKIEFTEEIVDPNQLESYLVDFIQVKPEKAEKIVYNLSEKLLNQFLNYDAVDFEDIGRITRTENKEIQFEAFPKLENFKYGTFPEVKIPSLIREDSKIEEVIPADLEKVKLEQQDVHVGINESEKISIKESNTSNLPKDPVGINNESIQEPEVKSVYDKLKEGSGAVVSDESSKSPYVKQHADIDDKRSLWPWLIGLLLLCCIIFGIFKCTGNKDPFNDQSRTNTMIDHGGDEYEDTIVLGSKKTMIDTTSNGEQSLVLDKPCTIILGSYTKRNNMEAMISLIKKKNLGTYQSSFGPHTRVGFSFDCESMDQEQLEKYMRDIRSEFNTKGAWYLFPELIVK